MGVRGLRGEERRVENGRWDKVAMSKEDKTTKQVEIGRIWGTNDLSDKRGGAAISIWVWIILRDWGCGRENTRKCLVCERKEGGTSKGDR